MNQADQLMYRGEYRDLKTKKSVFVFFLNIAKKLIQYVDVYVLFIIASLELNMIGQEAQKFFIYFSKCVKCTNNYIQGL